MTGAPRARALQLIAAGLILCASACVTVSPPPFLMAAPQREWGRTLALAQRSTSEGRFDMADSILAAFGARYSGTREALETTYWRAVFAMDPANRSSSLTTAMTLFDAYLGDARDREHALEAASLRRLAGQADVLAKQAAASNQRDVASTTRVGEAKPEAKPAEAKPADTPNADAEIKRLKDELAKANAELDRIRRRLAQPPKP